MQRFLFLLLSVCMWSVHAQDFLRAPNSYIFDLDYAKTNGYDGLNIPVKKVYSVWGNPDYFLPSTVPSGTQSAYVYWEDVPGLIRSVSVSGSGENALIKVAVNPAKGKGNALISLHIGNSGSENDPIYWSWHVWVTDDPGGGVIYTQGFETDREESRFDPKFMDRNLGAVSKHFLGDDWHKSGGLLYQWGRKDPLPPLLYKDRTYYELNGVAGHLVNQDVIAKNPLNYKIIKRPSSDEGENIKYAIQHPVDIIFSPDNKPWFSEKVRKTENPSTAWDLWSDNYGGKASNANSSNPEVSKNSKSYELKSPYDPCPGGWRVPSNYGREASNNNLSPFGRINSGGDDDKFNDWSATDGFYLNPSVNNGKPFSTLTGSVENEMLKGLKVYPKLGFDFSEVSDRNLGLIPVNGDFVAYGSGNNVNIIYQDELASGGLWSATWGGSEARYTHFIADTDQPDFGIGRYLVRINEVTATMAGRGVRCMKDPNEEIIGFFGTDYYKTNQYTVYTKGLDQPNSFMVSNTGQTLRIPVNKAFSVYNQFLSEGDMLPYDDLKANVLWTTDKQMIQKISLDIKPDPRDSEILVKFNSGKTGNAVISLHNGNISNPVYWSWHIWAPAGEVGTLSYTTEETLPVQHNIVNLTESGYPPLTTTFMDRNLGAIEKFPTVSNPSSPNTSELEKIKQSGGFHYQWGRKDPLPGFQNPGSAEEYEIYKGTLVNNDGTVVYNVLTSGDYASYYAENYSSYASAAGFTSGDDKFRKAEKVIRYSVQNPLTFLYHPGTGEAYDFPNNIDYTNIRDWVSNSVAPEEIRSLLPDRWGHGTSKSVFDPCPDGWRVPDFSVVLLRTAAKGTSPWYFGENGSEGVNQQYAFNIVTTYGGTPVTAGSKTLGWMLDGANFHIGNFPKTGMRGELGGFEISGNTGVWTSALGDYMTGYGLAMRIKSEGYLQSGTGVYPQAGLNVRCAKDEARYTAGEHLNTQEFVIGENEDVLVYPNPVADYLNINSEKEFNYEIFDLNGRQLRSGKASNHRIDFTSLPKGVYILVLDINITKKIVKR